MSSLGIIGISIVSHVAVDVLGLVKIENRQLVTRHYYARHIMPVGLAMAGTLATGNAVYLYLDVAMIQMLKAATPAIVLLGLSISGIEQPTRQISASVIVICAATCANVAGAVSFTLHGMVLMLLSEVFEAVRLIITQRLLVNQKFGIIEGQYWLGPASAISLLLLSAVTEGPALLSKDHSQTIIYENSGKFSLSVFLGVMVNFSGFLVVQTSGAVTLKVLGTVRSAAFVLFSVIFFHEIVTMHQFVCYAITLLAFSYYTYLKMPQSKSDSEAKSSTMPKTSSSNAVSNA